jgi:hypothetical protein
MYQETVAASTQRDRKERPETSVSRAGPDIRTRYCRMWGRSVINVQSGRTYISLCENTVHDLLYLSIFSSWNTNCEPRLDFLRTENWLESANIWLLKAAGCTANAVEMYKYISNASGIKYVLSVTFTLLSSKHFLYQGMRKKNLFPWGCFIINCFKLWENFSRLHFVQSVAAKVSLT